MTKEHFCHLFLASFFPQTYQADTGVPITEFMLEAQFYWALPEKQLFHWKLDNQSYLKLNCLKKKKNLLNMENLRKEGMQLTQIPGIPTEWTASLFSDTNKRKPEVKLLEWE